ncbi:MAG: LPS export ABC transporter periplasmic protein LptC [Deltaproteobacteria bacterium]|jgi:LPS export ABC transporter protein LptC|nr:LPS export ABC transporter periplasmic protein LptC [Deltaproteobacteria bacterium]
MSRIRFAILCSLVGFVIALGILLWNAKNLAGFKLGSLQNMLPANVDMRLGNLILSETGGDGRLMKIKAESAHYFKDEDYFLLSDVDADIFSKGTYYSVSALNGRYEPKEKLVILTGRVRTADSSGRILTGQKMSLDMDQGTFSSEQDFCLEDPTSSLSGKSFVYDTKTGQLEVEGRVFMLISQSDQSEEN